jgi:hypothetical protein
MVTDGPRPRPRRRPIQVDYETHRLIDIEATARDVTMGLLVRDAVRAYLGADGDGRRPLRRVRRRDAASA